MALNTAVKRELTIKLEQYEGRVNHLYLDVVGRVTVGIGHLIPTRNKIVAVPMYKIDQSGNAVIASLAEKQKEYDRIVQLPSGIAYTAQSYQKHTMLYMDDADINTQRDQHINSFYAELSNFYSSSNGCKTDFDYMPVEVQKALFDMVFNLGLTKLSSQFVKFNTAIKNEKWDVAAKQSYRVGIGGVRNKYVHDLLSAAHANASAVVSP